MGWSNPVPGPCRAHTRQGLVAQRVHLAVGVGFLQAEQVEKPGQEIQLGRGDLAV